MKSAPIAGHKWYWFHKDDTYGRTDIVDKTKIIELYRKTPTGELLHDTSLPPRSLLPNHEYEQAHVWETTRKSQAPPRFDGDNQNQQSHSAEDDGNAENKTILLTNGIVANWCLLPNDTKTTQPTPQGSDPSAFQYLPAPTDRQRKAQVSAIAEMDIQALYWQIIIGSQWLIPRTLDPTHIPSTTTSSSWVNFFKHPTLKIHEIRKALLIPIYSHGITQTLRDSIYHVQQDALAIGHRP